MLRRLLMLLLGIVVGFVIGFANGYRQAEIIGKQNMRMMRQEIESVRGIVKD